MFLEFVGSISQLILFGNILQQQKYTNPNDRMLIHILALCFVNEFADERKRKYKIRSSLPWLPKRWRHHHVSRDLYL